MNTFFTREEAAEHLRVSTRTLDRYVRKNILKTHKKGRRTYFLRDDVMSILSTPDHAPQVVSGETNMPVKPDEQITAMIGLVQEIHKEMLHKDAEIARLNFEVGRLHHLQEASIPLLEAAKKEEAANQQIDDIAGELQRTHIFKNVFLMLLGLSLAGFGITLHFILG